jgi:hypothetical protein
MASETGLAFSQIDDWFKGGRQRRRKTATEWMYNTIILSITNRNGVIALCQRTIKKILPWPNGSMNNVFAQDWKDAS